MSLRGLFLVFLVALIQVAGNLMLRAGVGRAGGLALSAQAFFQDILQLVMEPLFVVGVVLYGVSSILWFAVISTEELNRSYPLLVSISFILVTVGATFFFQESLSIQKIVGVFVLLVGILMVATAAS